MNIHIHLGALPDSSPWSRTTTSPGLSTVSGARESQSDNATPSWHFGFPKEGRYSLSYWLRGVQGNSLLNHRTTPELPSSADIVVIGSGVSTISEAVPEIS